VARNLPCAGESEQGAGRAGCGSEEDGHLADEDDSQDEHDDVSQRIADLHAKELLGFLVFIVGTHAIGLRAVTLKHCYTGLAGRASPILLGIYLVFALNSSI
jgi:hypothetical protein